jgi:transcriptional regulator with XRE-family HTH domain
MMPGSLAERLRVLRAQRGLTLLEAAEKTGVGRDTLSDLERGRRHPVMPTLTKIAQGYGVPVEDLLEEPVTAGKVKAPHSGAGEPIDATILEDRPDPDVLLEQLHDWEVPASREEAIVLSQLLALDKIETDEWLRVKVFAPYLEDGTTVNVGRVQKELLPLFLADSSSMLHATLRKDLAHA